MKFLLEICFYLTRLRNDIFVIVKTNVFGIDDDMLVLGQFRGFFLTFQHVAIVFHRAPTFVLERLLSCVKTALVANRVFHKTCPEVVIQVY